MQATRLSRDGGVPTRKSLPLDRDQLAAAAAEGELGDRGRVLIRDSGTEPLLRVMVEGEDGQVDDDRGRQTEEDRPIDPRIECERRHDRPDRRRRRESRQPGAATRRWRWWR